MLETTEMVGCFHWAPSALPPRIVLPLLNLLLHAWVGSSYQLILLLPSAMMSLFEWSRWAKNIRSSSGTGSSTPLSSCRAYHRSGYMHCLITILTVSIRFPDLKADKNLIMSHAQSYSGSVDSASMGGMGRGSRMAVGSISSERCATSVSTCTSWKHVMVLKNCIRSWRC